MAGVMASSCCVCRCQLKEAVGKGRHKRLCSCSKEKSVWEQLAKECECFDTIKLAFYEDNAVLCYSCIERAKKLDKFVYQWTKQRKEMASILGCSVNDSDSEMDDTTTLPHTASQQPPTPQRTSRRTKRSRATTEPAKKPRTSVSITACEVHVQCKLSQASRLNV